MFCLEYGLVRFRDVQDEEQRGEVGGKCWNIIVEKDVEYEMDV